MGELGRFWQIIPHPNGVFGQACKIPRICHLLRAQKIYRGDTPRPYGRLKPDTNTVLRSATFMSRIFGILWGITKQGQTR